VYRIRIKRLRSERLDGDFLLDEIDDWAEYLRADDPEEDLKLLRRHGATGRPLGDPLLIEKLSKVLDRDLMPKKPGPKPRLSV